MTNLLLVSVDVTPPPGHRVGIWLTYNGHKALVLAPCSSYRHDRRLLWGAEVWRPALNLYPLHEQPDGPDPTTAVLFMDHGIRVGPVIIR